MSAEAIIQSVVAKWHKRNPWLDKRDLAQEAWLACHGAQQNRAWWHATKACGSFVAAANAAVDYPCQYLTWQGSRAAKQAQQALRGVSLQTPLANDEACDYCMQDALVSFEPSAESRLDEKRSVERAQSKCIGHQRAMLEGLLAGKSLADVARERGVSRAKVSLEYLSLKAKMVKA